MLLRHHAAVGHRGHFRRSGGLAVVLQKRSGAQRIEVAECIVHEVTADGGEVSTQFIVQDVRIQSLQGARELIKS